MLILLSWISTFKREVTSEQSFGARHLLLRTSKIRPWQQWLPLPGLPSPWVRNPGAQRTSELFTLLPSPAMPLCMVSLLRAGPGLAVKTTAAQGLSILLHFATALNPRPKRRELLSSVPAAVTPSCTIGGHHGEKNGVKINLPPETPLEMMADGGAFGSLYFWDQLSSRCSAFGLRQRGCGTPLSVRPGVFWITDVII